MSEYQGSHRAPGLQWGRLIPLVVYGAAFVGLAATLSGWWR
jgi:hypothetical protein